MATDSITISITSLLCDEDDDGLLFKSTGVVERLEFENEFDEEYVEMLIGKEDGDVVKGFEFETDHFDDKSSNWPAVAHLHAVNWILNARSLFGFQFTTVYMAIAYVDRFISCQSISDGQNWAVRLVSVACLSVAAKMEELNVPVLSDYSFDEYKFEKLAIQRMELLLLSTLGWKMSCITPFAYFGYFADKFSVDSESKSKNQLFIKATELVTEMLPRINLMSFSPSSIAAAAILAAIDDQLTEKSLEIKLGLIQLSRPHKYKKVLSLYCLLQEIGKKNCKTPEKDILLSRPLWKSPATHEKLISTISFTGTKRQLSYNENDKDHERSLKKTIQ